MIQLYTHTHVLEKSMATHSSILAWKIPWTEEPGGLQSMGLQRLRHDRVTNTHTHIHVYILRLLSITSYYKILNIFPVLYSKALLLMFFMHSSLYPLILYS